MPEVYDLEEAQNLAKSRSKVTVKGRASDQYIVAQGLHGKNRKKNAERDIMQGIKQLADHLFSHVYNKHGLPCDVYGLPDFKGGDWYVKLHIENGRLIVVSFHPPKDDILDEEGGKICGP